MASVCYIVITGVSICCRSLYIVDIAYCLFIFIGTHRHDIISNEIRTNLTINFVMNNLMYLMLAVPGVNVIHMITPVTGAPSLVLVSAF